MVVSLYGWWEVGFWGRQLGHWGISLKRILGPQSHSPLCFPTATGWATLFTRASSKINCHKARSQLRSWTGSSESMSANEPYLWLHWLSQEFCHSNGLLTNHLVLTNCRGLTQGRGVYSTTLPLDLATLLFCPGECELIWNVGMPYPCKRAASLRTSKRQVNALVNSMDWYSGCLFVQ